MSEYDDFINFKEEDEPCYGIGHIEEVIYEDDDGLQWICKRCGAEGWEEYDD